MWCGFFYSFVFIFGVHKKSQSIFIPIFVSIVLILITLLLGIWQIQRLNWKNSLINNFNILKNSEAIDLSLIDKKEFIKIKSKGVVNRKNKVFFPAKTLNGKAGVRLASEFISENGEIYLLDEGWFDNSNLQYFRENNDIFEENIIGYTRFPIKGKFFTPNNDFNNNEWYTYDLKSINNYFSSSINQVFFIKKTNSNKENFLFASEYKHKFRNNHMQYAITWFSMSLAFLIMSIVYLKKNKYE